MKQIATKTPQSKRKTKARLDLRDAEPKDEFELPFTLRASEKEALDKLLDDHLAVILQKKASESELEQTTYDHALDLYETEDNDESISSFNPLAKRKAKIDFLDQIHQEHEDAFQDFLSSRTVVKCDPSVISREWLMDNQWRSYCAAGPPPAQVKETLINLDVDLYKHCQYEVFDRNHELAATFKVSMEEAEMIIRDLMKKLPDSEIPLWSRVELSHLFPIQVALCERRLDLIDLYEMLAYDETIGNRLCFWLGEWLAKYKFSPYMLIAENSQMWKADGSLIPDHSQVDIDLTWRIARLVETIAIHYSGRYLARITLLLQNPNGSQPFCAESPLSIAAGNGDLALFEEFLKIAERELELFQSEFLLNVGYQLEFAMMQVIRYGDLMVCQQALRLSRDFMKRNEKYFVENDRYELDRSMVNFQRLAFVGSSTLLNVAAETGNPDIVEEVRDFLELVASDTYWKIEQTAFDGESYNFACLRHNSVKLLDALGDRSLWSIVQPKPAEYGAEKQWLSLAIALGNPRLPELIKSKEELLSNSEGIGEPLSHAVLVGDKNLFDALLNVVGLPQDSALFDALITAILLKDYDMLQRLLQGLEDKSLEYVQPQTVIMVDLMKKLIIMLRKPGKSTPDWARKAFSKLFMANNEIKES